MRQAFTLSKLFFICLILSLSSRVFSQVSFAPENVYTTTNSPGSTCIGDMNNDGLMDVVMSAWTSGGSSINIYLQNSSGGLNNPVSYPCPGVRAMAVGDVNNDGLADVVICNGDSIGIYFQQPNGTIGGYEHFYSGNGPVDGVSIGDVNNDGLNDIVASNWNSSWISVYYQQPAGGYTYTTYPSYQAGYDDIIIGDVNNDGLNDVVLMSGQGWGGFHVYIQNNSGTLNTAIDYSMGAGTNFSGIAIGDVNNDGRNDIVTSVGGNYPNAKVCLWLQDSVTHMIQSSPASILTTLDGAGPVYVAKIGGCSQNSQIVLMNGGWDAVSVLSQDTAGNYSNYHEPGYQTFPTSGADWPSMAIGDINNDGKIDVAVGSSWGGSPLNGLLTLLNTSSSSAGGVASVNISTPTTSICSGSAVTFMANASNGGGAPSYQWKINNVNEGTSAASFNTALLNNNDTVKCIMTSNAACVSGSPATSNPIIITVNAKGDAGIVTSLRDTVCLGTATHLSSNGAGGNDYQWQSSTTGSYSDISGATSTTYATLPLNETTFYRLIAGNGACADTSTPLKVQVVDAPATVYSYAASDLKLSFSAVDSNNNIASYSWNFGDSTNSTEQNPTHTYAKEGTYYVCLTVYNNSNCSYTYCKDIDVELNGIQTISGEGSWNVFPNPFKDYINIGSLNAQPVESITVYDMLGQKVIEQNFEKGNKQQHISVEASSLAEGVYYLTIESNQESYTIPLIK